MPKWSMRVGEKSILELAIESLCFSKLPIDEYVFVVLESQVSLAKELVMKSALKSFEIVSVAETPDGQARSVELALRKTGVVGDFLVWNGDTHLRVGWDDSIQPTGDWMLLSKLPGVHWSFAQIEDSRVIKTAEKVRISEFASLGLYGFQNPTIFLTALEEQTASGEKYVAPLYNSLIERGFPVEAHVIESSLMVPLGTPREVYDSCLKNKWTLPEEMTSWSPDN